MALLLGPTAYGTTPGVPRNPVARTEPGPDFTNGLRRGTHHEETGGGHSHSRVAVKPGKLRQTAAQSDVHSEAVI